MTAAVIAEPVPTSEDAPKRAVIYCRISKDSAKLGLGVERQEKVCRALAAKYRWDVVQVMVENDTSSLKGLKARPLYRELLAMIEAGEVEVVVSWAQDRLLRSTLELEGLITLAEVNPFTIAHQVDMWTDLSTASGRENARYHVARSKGEMERKSERQKGAYQQSAESGKPPNGRAFGYERNGTIIPAEADVVRDMFARYVAGQGINGLMTELNDQRIVNTKGTPWSRYGISWMLANPRYMGERHRVVIKDGRKTWEYVCGGQWEPIVTPEMFKAAQARLADNRERAHRAGPNKKWLGSGMLVCSICGNRMQIFYQNYRTKDGVVHPGRRYACMPSRHLVRNALEIDELIEVKVAGYLTDNDLAALMETDRDKAESRSLREQGQALQNVLDGLDDLVANLEISARLAGQIERTTMEKLAIVDAKWAKLGERSALALVAGANDPGLAWKKLLEYDIAAAQAVVDAIAVITVNPGKRGRGKFDPATVEIAWKVQPKA